MASHIGEKVMILTASLETERAIQGDGISFNTKDKSRADSLVSSLCRKTSCWTMSGDGVLLSHNDT